MKNKWVKWSLIIIGVLVVLKIITAMFGPSQEEKDNKRKQNLISKIESSNIDSSIVALESVSEQSNIYSWANSKLDSLKGVKRESEINSLIKSLNVEIESLKKGIDFKKYYNDPDKMKFGLAMFKIWANKIVKGYDEGNDSTKVLSKELEKLVINEQEKQFPNFRRSLAKELKDNYWEDNIKVTLTGKKADILNFKGAIFLNNANIKKFHKELLTLFKDYRISQVRYDSALRKDIITMDVSSLSDDGLDIN